MNTANSREKSASFWEKQPSPVWVSVADPVPDRNNFLGKADAFRRGVFDTMSFGTADEIGAALKTGSIFGLNDGLWGDYDHELAWQRAIDADDARNRPGYRLAGQLAGGVTSAAGLGRLGLSAATRLAGRGLTGRAVGGAADGLGQGAVYGFNSGEDGFGSRVANIPAEALSGAVVGPLGEVVSPLVRARAIPRQVLDKPVAAPVPRDPTPVAANRPDLPEDSFVESMAREYVLDDIKGFLKDPDGYIDREPRDIFPESGIGESWTPAARGDRLVSRRPSSDGNEKRKVGAPLPRADWPWRLPAGNPDPQRFSDAHGSLPASRFHAASRVVEAPETGRMQARFGKPVSNLPLDEAHRATFVQAAKQRGDLPVERATRILQELMLGAPPPHVPRREPLELTIGRRSKNF